MLDSATQLQAGTAYSDSKAALAEPALQTTLENNGYYRGQIAQTTVIDHENSLVDLNFYTTTGNPARVGDVEVCRRAWDTSVPREFI